MLLQRGVNLIGPGLNRIGAGHEKNHDQADDDSRIILQNAFSLASKLGGIVISRQTDVELKEAMSKSGSDGFELHPIAVFSWSCISLLWLEK